jgi:hypothetical protein
MSHVSYAIILSCGLFTGMFLMLELGHRLAVRVERLDPGAHRGTGPVEGAVFALLGLLVAFSFSGAATRFDARRHLVVEEANAIGTAFLRIDTLPAAEQPAMRDLFRRYLDARLAVYRAVPDFAAVHEELVRSEGLQNEIWSRSVAACAGAGAGPCAILVLPALNAMIDIATTRVAAVRIHPPAITFWLLAGLGLGCALLAGYSMADGKRRKWTHIVGFAAVTAITFYVILDLEYPRLGLIRIDAFDQLLVDVRASMDRGGS